MKRPRQEAASPLTAPDPPVRNAVPRTCALALQCLPLVKQDQPAGPERPALPQCKLGASNCGLEHWCTLATHHRRKAKTVLVHQTLGQQRCKQFGAADTKTSRPLSCLAPCPSRLLRPSAACCSPIRPPPANGRPRPSRRRSTAAEIERNSWPDVSTAHGALEEAFGLCGRRGPAREARRCWPAQRMAISLVIRLALTASLSSGCGSSPMSFS